jgi:hypothetical protein
MKNAAEPKKPAPKRPADARDAAVQRGFAALAAVLAGNAPQGKGKGGRVRIGDGILTDRDFYFLWSLERVGVIFGVDKIGGIDWYDFGANELIPAQHANGSWGKGAKGSEVETAFALLFLARSNLVRDLSAKVQKGGLNAELRAGAGPVAGDPVAAPAPVAKGPGSLGPAPGVTIKPAEPAVPLIPGPAENPRFVVAGLLVATDAEWDKALATVRDAKGDEYSQALAQIIPKLDGERLNAARETLALRLSRLTGEALRAMAKDKDVELRRAAAAAMALKKDKALIPDLIVALLDDEELVVSAAKAGLKTVTGQDFGPAAGANFADRAAAAKVWLDWLQKQK